MTNLSRQSLVWLAVRRTMVAASVLGVGLMALTHVAHAANPAFVKLVEKDVASNSNSINTGNFSSAVTAGNLIVIRLWYYSPTQSVSSVVDSKGNTYSKAVGPTTGTGALAGWRQEIWYAKNVVGGTNVNATATFTGSFSNEKYISANEYSGVDQSSPLDVTAAAVVTATNASSGLATTHASNELLFGAGLFPGQGTAGSGFTARSLTAGNVSEDKVAGAAGPYAATFTNSSQVVIAQLAAFKAASSTADTQPPTAPTNLSATSTSSSQINLSWTASTDNVGVAGYKVFQNGTQIATTTATTYQSIGLAASTTYSYSVSAFDAANNVSGQSNTAVATTLPNSDVIPPSVPTNLQASNIGASSLTISWTASTDNVGVAGYQVFRNGSQIATTTAVSYQDTNLIASTTYSYSVSAFDAAMNISARSQSLNVTTLGVSQGGPAYPLKDSANNRYLVDQNGAPFMIVGDSPHSLFVNMTEAQADMYFANRQAKGFNSVWIEILCNAYTGGRDDGSTYDGIVPFTTPGDFSTPNDAYFSRIDDMVRLAAAHNITVFMDPVDLDGWISTVRNNSIANNQSYGEYLGNRYKNFNNIVWLNGNDFQTWKDPNDDAHAEAIALGIKSTDTRHIQTIELDFPISASLDDSNWAPIINLDAAYTYYPTYGEVLQEYNRTSSMPVFMVESNYEFENGATPLMLRSQEYWSILSGAEGQLYGNHYTWTLPAGWQNELDTPGAIHFGYMNNFFSGRQWYNLVPDQFHTVVTSGIGTLGGLDYLTDARVPDGSLVVAYMPSARTITVDMTQLAGPVTARWFDPTSNTYSAISGSPFANTGTRQFTPTGNNSGGDSDWVLVLEANAIPDTQPPSVPQNLSAQGVSVSQINLSWSASTDNVGVSGYKVFRDGAQVATTTQNSFSDSGLAQQTSHTYAVAAFDAAGNVSALSSSTVGTTTAPDTIPPSVPSNLQSPTSTSASVTITWTASTDNVAVAGYHVYRNGAIVGSSTQAMFVDTGLTASTTYTYTVDAFDSSGNVSAQSAGFAATTGAPQPFAIGETTVFPGDDGANGNLLIAQDAVLGQPATIQSLSFYVTTAAGNLRLGIYDATGPGGGPGVKKAETNSFVPVSGWNTANVITPVSLSAGTYWLAYLPSSNSLTFKANFSSGTFKYYSYQFATMPATFSTTPTTGTTHWSFYATLNP